MSPTVSVQDFFEAPVVNREWRVRSTDPTLVRFGLLWRVYDWLAEMGLEYQVPILGSWDILYLRGGMSGQDFLVSASGLDQPKAGKGVIHLDFPRCDTLQTIRHKTKGVPDRQFTLGFQRWNRRTGAYDLEYR